MTTGIAVPATATPPAIPGSGVYGDAKKNDVQIQRALSGAIDARQGEEEVRRDHQKTQDCILRGGC